MAGAGERLAPLTSREVQDECPFGVGGRSGADRLYLDPRGDEMAARVVGFACAAPDVVVMPFWGQRWGWVALGAGARTEGSGWRFGETLESKGLHDAGECGPELGLCVHRGERLWYCR